MKDWLQILIGIGTVVVSCSTAYKNYWEGRKAKKDVKNK
jgi:hypothetical protein